ncbi:hypothetical protein Syun_021308 [Stephania yunnanensis]|uniref:Uncharacterized protein n=1 Tax=Stephania yunnanensis TaxID=152371 RepID=A0AAP0IGU4_9MAGN
MTSSGNHRMIHKKGGRIRTYGRPARPRLPLGLGGGLTPLVASVPETDALRYPACCFGPPTLRKSRVVKRLIGSRSKRVKGGSNSNKQRGRHIHEKREAVPWGTDQRGSTWESPSAAVVTGSSDSYERHLGRKDRADSIL